MSDSSSPSVSTGNVGSVKTIILKEPDFGAEAHIAPSAGFNCFRFERAFEGCRVPVLYSTDSEEFLLKGGTGFGYPQLFPFPNRVKDGKYTVAGIDHQLEINHRTNHIHGLVINKEWKEVSSGVNDELGAYVTGVFKASDYAESILEQFPFPFRFSITYSLKGGNLTLDVKAENKGDEVLPMGYGTHPYFPVPIVPGGHREQCEILIPANKYWKLENSIPTGEVLPVSDRLDARSFRLLGKNTYDDVLTDIIMSEGGSSCVVRDLQAGLQIRIWADSGHREWVVYAPEGRDLVAFEPYTCATDAVNLHAQGIDAGWIELRPGEVWSGRQVVSLEKI